MNGWTWFWVIVSVPANVLPWLLLLRYIRRRQEERASADMRREVSQHQSETLRLIREIESDRDKCDKWRRVHLVPVQAQNDALRKQLDALTTTLHASQLEVGKVIKQRDAAQSLLDHYRAEFQCDSTRRRTCSYARKVPA